MPRKKNDKGTDTTTTAEVTAIPEPERKKGRERLPRINMAFTQENHDFLRVMARASGQTLTQFTNLIITTYRKEHPELAEKANKLLAEILETGFTGLRGEE